MIKNIIFDMGNVLLSYEPETYAEKLCRKEAAEVILRELFLGHDWAKQDLGLVGKEELYKLVKVRVPEEYHTDLRAAIYHWFDLMRPIPGAEEFLKKMKKQGYRLYVLSNAGKEFYEYFPRHYDYALFDRLIVSCDLQIKKPDPRIYRYLLETEGLRPEECLFIDDMPENVSGAQALGIQGMVFRGLFEEVEKKLN